MLLSFIVSNDDFRGFECVMFSSYAVVIDEDEPVVNQSIVQEVVEASQASFSQELCEFDLLLYAHQQLCKRVTPLHRPRGSCIQGRCDNHYTTI